jgi:hypothetical protein
MYTTDYSAIAEARNYPGLENDGLWQTGLDLVEAGEMVPMSAPPYTPDTRFLASIYNK